MGLGPDILHKHNPKLIIVRISGFGQTGPYSDRPGFGSLVEGMSGFAFRNGFPDRPPLLPPIAMADMIAGLQGAYATMVALREIELKGGQGQVIDMSLLEPILSTLGPAAMDFKATGDIPAESVIVHIPLYLAMSIQHEMASLSRCRHPFNKWLSVCLGRSAAKI